MDKCDRAFEYTELRPCVFVVQLKRNIYYESRAEIFTVAYRNT